MSLALEQIFIPGKLLDVLPRRTEVLSEKQVRHAMVLGVKEEDLVLSLPDPPLTDPLIGQALEITFLTQKADQSERFGYFTLILDTLEDFEARAGHENGLVVLYPHKEDIIPTTLRHEKRYKVNGRQKLGLKVKGLSRPTLEDISLSGLRFRCENCNQIIKKDQNLEISLIIKRKTYPLTGKVIESRRQKSSIQVRMALDTLPLDLWSYLIKVLHELDSNGKGGNA